ncbi:MAG: DUF4105 domain-containing protein [Pseudomonadota bacterium]
MLSVIRALLILLVVILAAIFTLWGCLALWFRLPGPEGLRLFVVAAFGLIGVATVIAQFTAARLRFLAVFGPALAGILVWWSTIDPPTEGNWSPDVARQVTGSLNGEILTLTNVRNFQWRAAADFTQAWETRSYDLSTLTGVDLFMSYWSGPAIAHMVVSFGFENGEYLAWSVEVRREVNSGFSPLADAFKTHTLVLVAADERDVVGTRTNIRGEDVQLYRIKADLDDERQLLLKYVSAANQMAEQPQWYNSVTANCTTVVMELIRTVIADVPLDWRVFVNGYLPGYVYDRGVVDTKLSLEDLIEASKITARAQQIGITPEFSAQIRQGIPAP